MFRHDSGLDSWVCGCLEVASLSPGPSMTFSVIPCWKISVVSLVMWWWLFLEGYTIILQPTSAQSILRQPHPLLPQHPAPHPPGQLVRKSPFRVASNWIFPTCLKSSSCFSLLFVEMNAGPNTAPYLFLLPSSVNSYSLQISQVFAHWRRKPGLRWIVKGF